jgi:hypothetical protein
MSFICKNIKSNWITYLNVRPETLKLLQERVVNILEHIVIGNNFLNRTPVAQKLRGSINKWAYMKLKASAQ